MAGEFELHAQAVLVTSGGIGANHDLVRQNWPAGLGPAPQRMISGVPAHVDGRMLGITEQAGGRIVNPDRMWHYTEGIQNWDPIWHRHGIRILPGPPRCGSTPAAGGCPAPHFPGFDTLGTLRAHRPAGYDYSWFVLTQKIIEKEFALSGSEQNPDLTGKDIRRPAGPGPGRRARPGRGVQGARCRLRRAPTPCPSWCAGMNKLTDEPLIDLADLERQIAARDREIDNPFGKDAQVMAIRGARRYARRPDRSAPPPRTGSWTRRPAR